MLNKEKSRGKRISFPWTKELNPDQRRAVEKTEGPLMVLAGAGSGKTRVIAYRIAYLIASRKVRAERILALTFTNKAAGEMKQRVLQLIKLDDQGLWIGTFHSIFARILRREGKHIGYNSLFTIYDQTDQLSAIKSIIKQKNIPIGDYTPKEILNSISMLKSRLITHTSYSSKEPDDFKSRAVAPVYTAYSNLLRQNNGMDFDDLLFNTYLLFKNNPDILEKYQRKFKYILVDEFQDTNIAQYRILLQLADKSQNICVVGDDDQSIYRWRGAEIKNILQFEHDFDNTSVVRLEQNYRSTKFILNAANSVIKNNRIRHPKQLWTNRSDGEKLTLQYCESDYKEAEWVAQSIESKVFKENRSWDNFAILYRMNAQSRLLEDNLRRKQIPYTIIGGHKFYDRKEVKDVLAYLSILVNPEDGIGLKRIINYPARGVGKKTITIIENFAESRNISLFKSLKEVDSIEGIPAKRRETIGSFYKLISKYRKLQKQVSMVELVMSLIEEVKILQHLQAESVHDPANRLGNVKELLRAIDEYALHNPDATLENYLTEIALYTDLDGWDNKRQQVSLMTVHSAKGLEFPVVFLTGLEEGIFPTVSSLIDIEEMEEERRLFYVAVTRAEDSLNISAAHRRGLFDELKIHAPSPFLEELDKSTIFQSDYAPAFTLGSPKKTYSPGEVKSVGNTSSESGEKYQIGMRVQHQDFGIGIIKAKDGYGSSEKLTIVFQGNIEKKLLVQYATLSIAD